MESATIRRILERAGADPVVVTGIGPVSAIGCGRDDFWNALIEGRHGFAPLTLCDPDCSSSKVAAEVKGFRLDRYVAGGRVMARHLSRPTQLALAASVLALHDAQLDLDRIAPERLGVLVGTSVANMGEMSAAVRGLEAGQELGPGVAFRVFNHSTACVLSSFFNIQGPIHTTTSGCNSGLDALGLALRMIQGDAVDVMLVVGTDCEVVPEVLAALNASDSLSTRYNDQPERASRPFDRGRDGNVVGEGAAALVLETEPAARARRTRIYARLRGHQVCAAGRNRQYSHDRPELDTGPFVRAMAGVVSQAGWRPEDVDLVSANGSSSVLYDKLEAGALAEVFGERLPQVRVHSTKSMLGQHGAGTSALQAAAGCLSIRRGAVPPTINHEDPDPECGPLRVVTTAEKLDPERILLNAIGFGGFYYSCLALESPEWDGASSGLIQARWSAQQHPRFRPAEEFHHPLVPWSPREG